MTVVSNPPITQYRVETRLADGSLVDVIAAHVNGRTDLETILAECAAERAENPGAIIGTVTVLGRRRLNDYVGSPIFSEWEVLRERKGDRG